MDLIAAHNFILSAPDIKFFVPGEREREREWERERKRGGGTDRKHWRCAPFPQSVIPSDCLVLSYYFRLSVCLSFCLSFSFRPSPLFPLSSFCLLLKHTTIYFCSLFLSRSEFFFLTYFPPEEKSLWKDDNSNLPKKVQIQAGLSTLFMIGKVMNR